MSVLFEFSMFPTDKGESVSEYVSKIIKMIDKSGVKYQLTAMGSIVECDTMENALKVINDSYKVLEPYSNRIYCDIKLDIRKNRQNAITSKIKSIQDKIDNDVSIL